MTEQFLFDCLSNSNNHVFYVRKAYNYYQQNVYISLNIYICKSSNCNVDLT